MRSCNILVSFAEGELEVEKFLGVPGWRVLLDSGAYANFTRDLGITVEAYIEFLQQHRSAFWRYFALDKIADAAVSRANLQRMLRAGLNPIPVFQRGGLVADLDELREVSDVLAVGGIAGRLNKKADRRYLHQLIRAAAGHRLHLLGCGNVEVLTRYRPYSADSSSHATRHGDLRIWDGTRFRLLQWKARRTPTLDRVPVAEQRVSFGKLCESYGIDPARTAERDFFMSFDAKVMSLRSYMRFQASLRKLGTEYFIALVDADRRPAIAAWELERDHEDMRTTA